MTFGLKFLNRDIKAQGDGVSWLLLQSRDSSTFCALLPSQNSSPRSAVSSLALLNRKEAEYWNALYLHHCVSIAYLLDLFPLSCNLAFALSLLSPSPRTRLAYCPCSHPLTTKGEITTGHRASKCLFEVFRHVWEIFLFLLWVRHLYWQHFIFKKTVIKIKRLNKLKNNHCCQYSWDCGLWTLAFPREHTCGLPLLLLFLLYSVCPFGPLCLYLIKFNSSLLLIKEGIFQWPEEEVDTTGMWPLAPGASAQWIPAFRPSFTFQPCILNILTEAERGAVPWPVLQRIEKREVSENGDTWACFLGVSTLLILSPAMSTGRN